jgi:hypothetical protein
MSESAPGATAPEHDPWYIDPEKNPDHMPSEKQPKSSDEMPMEIASHELEPLEAEPESMEQITLGLELLGEEIRELANAAAETVKRLEHPQTEEQHGLFRRLSGKVRARAAMTFAAVALAGALSGPAPVEAGERGRKVAYAGAVIAGEVDRELQQSYYESQQDAQQIEYAIRRMEDDANRFMDQYERLSERIARTEERIEDSLQRNRPEQVRRLMHDKDSMVRQQEVLKARADRLQGMIHRAHQDLIKAEKDATKARRISAGVRALGGIAQILARR